MLDAVRTCAPVTPLLRTLVPCLLLGSAGCPKEPWADQGPDRPLPITSTSGSTQVAKPEKPTGYFKTESSDEWVKQNFVLQTAYTRVLLVGEPKVESIEVAPPSLGSSREGAKTHKVDATFATIQEAIGASKPGDLVAVQPGTYGGFVIGGIPGAGPGAFTFIRALGAPGSVVIDRASADKSWMIYVRTGHHVVIEGFRLKGGGENAGPRAGIMLDGDFGRSGDLVRNVAVVGVYADRHRTWGMHATDTATVLVQDSAFSGSVLEHGMYVSDGSDDWVIRRNVFFDNYAGGLQINLDPLASLEETAGHVGMMGIGPSNGTRAWAQEVLSRATKEYGEHNFPDGRGVNFIVENNVSTNNGKKGGAAFNFAALTESLIQNNLTYGNYAGGLVLWDNANPYDEELTNNPPTSPDQWVPERKHLFGSRDNVVRFNTFFDAPSPRAAIQIRNGGWGNKLFGNVAVHGKGPGLWITADSLPGFEARRNVIGPLQMDKAAMGMVPLAAAMPAQASRADAAFDAVSASFVAPSVAPWIVIDGAWWKPASDRPDFRPKAGATLLAPFGDKGELTTDLLGRPRKADHPGALAP